MPKCEECGKELKPGDLYTATTVAPKRWWHRACFDATVKPLELAMVATDGKLTFVKP